MQSTSPLTSEAAPTVRSPASGGGKLGRVMFPLLLVLLLAAADAAFVRCLSATCGPSASETPPSTVEARAPDQQLEFPFPLGTSTFSGSGSSGLSLGFEEGANEDAEAVPEVQNAETTGVSTRKASVNPPQSQPAAQVQAPANTTPSFPQVGPATTGERATRHYRTYETPAPRRVYDHPAAGGDGAASIFAPAAGSQSSLTPSSTPSSPAPPPPPPPGQGSPGSFAPGAPGELAGFIG